VVERTIERDLPDRRLELFLRLCLGNHGRLSARERGLFPELTDEEVAAMEQVVQESGLGGAGRQA
jgi:hypothetical protein